MKTHELLTKLPLLSRRGRHLSCVTDKVIKPVAVLYGWEAGCREMIGCNPLVCAVSENNRP